MSDANQQESLPCDYEEQDSDYLDYLALRATQEMEAEYLPDAEEHQKMLELCEAILEHNNTLHDAKNNLVPIAKEKLELHSIDIIDVKVEQDNHNFRYDDYDRYYDLVLNTTLADILLQVQEVDLIETLRFEIGDPLDKYQDMYGVVQPLQVPSKLYMVAIIHELKKIVETNGWGFAYNNYSLYVYTKTHWQKIDADKLKRFLNIAAIKLGFYSPSDATTDTFVKSLLKQYQSQVPLIETPDAKNTVLVNLKNGTFEVNKNGIKFREHRKQDFIKHQLPYARYENAEAPIFKKYLDRVLPDMESQNMLQEFHGYIFTRHLKLEKALILYGTGANGKSVMYEITTALLGKENVSTKSFGELIDSDSGNANRASLQDKLLNFGSEIGAKKNMTLDIFKKLISGEPITARQKYEKSIEIDGYCKFMFNANMLPDVQENTEAYHRRLLIIPFNQRIPKEEQDPQLEQKIISTELPGILNWVIKGLERLLSQGKFSDCKASEEILSDYKIMANPIALFLEEKELTPDHTKEHKVTNKKIFEAFDTWRKLHGIAKINGPELSKRLISMDFTSWKSGSARGLYMNGNIDIQ